MSEKRMTVNLGFVNVLFIVFLVLKLTENIDWSWWWVTSPLWVPIPVILFFTLMVALLTHPRR